MDLSHCLKKIEYALQEGYVLIYIKCEACRTEQLIAFHYGAEDVICKRCSAEIPLEDSEHQLCDVDVASDI